MGKPGAKIIRALLWAVAGATAAVSLYVCAADMVPARAGQSPSGAAGRYASAVLDINAAGASALEELPQEEAEPPVRVAREALRANENLYLTDGRAAVLAEKDGGIAMTVNDFGKGRGVYMSGFRVSPESTRMLLELLVWLTGARALYLSDSAAVETAYYPADNVLVAVNNADAPAEARVALPEGEMKLALAPLEMRFCPLA